MPSAFCGTYGSKSLPPAQSRANYRSLTAVLGRTICVMLGCCSILHEPRSKRPVAFPPCHRPKGEVEAGSSDENSRKRGVRPNDVAGNRP